MKIFLRFILLFLFNQTFPIIGPINEFNDIKMSYQVDKTDSVDKNEDTQEKEQIEIERGSTYIGDLNIDSVIYTGAMNYFGSSNTLWQWDSISNYYLAEYTSPVGQAARAISYGTPIRINNINYEVVHIIEYLENDEDAFDEALYHLNNHGYHAAIQTCITATDWGPLRIIILQQV